MIKKLIIYLIFSTVLISFNFFYTNNAYSLQESVHQVNVLNDSNYNLWKKVKVWSANNNIDVNNIQKFFNGEVTSIELPPKTSITIGFEGELELEKLNISFKEGNIPSKIKIYSTDYLGARNYCSLFETDKNINSQLEIKANKSKAAYITIQILDETNSCTLNGFNMYGKPTYPEYFNKDSEIVLDAKDEKNPLNAWRIPVKRNIYLLAEDILNGKNDLTEHEKIVAFMNYMKDYKTGLSLSSPEYVFKDKIGSCGSYTNCLVALAATQGMEARIITMANYPKNAGHVVAEIKVNGKWGVYDPTYDIYYTTTPDDTKNPYVLSLDELKSGRGKDTDVKKVIGFPERLISQMANDFASPEIYTLANPCGIVSPRNKLYYPLSIDYNLDREITSNEFGIIYQGASYIGAAGMNNSHIWTINGLEKDKEYSFKINGTFVGGELQKNGILDSDFNAYATIENGTIISGENFTFNIEENKKEWVIKFKPQSDAVKITLSHNYVGPEFHYISLDKFAVE